MNNKVKTREKKPKKTTEHLEEQRPEPDKNQSAPELPAKKPGSEQKKKHQPSVPQIEKKKSEPKDKKRKPKPPTESEKSESLKKEKKTKPRIKSEKLEPLREEKKTKPPTESEKAETLKEEKKPHKESEKAEPLKEEKKPQPPKKEKKSKPPKREKESKPPKKEKKSKPHSERWWLKVKVAASHLLQKMNLRRLKPNKTALLLIAVFVVALMGFFWSRSAMRDFLERYDDGTILTGISIDGVDVSGMTHSEASGELRSRLMIYRENNIIFTIEGRDSFSGAFGEIDLDFKNLGDVVNQALEQGREGLLIRRTMLQWRANRGRLNVDIPIIYQISFDDLATLLEPHMEERLNVPSNARIESGVEGARVIPDRSGEIFDIENAYERILSYLNGHRDRARFTIDLTVKSVEAEITANQLEGITDLLGTFTTSFRYDNPNRVQNIENGARRIGRLLIEPGEELSACRLMGPYTEENGYTIDFMFMDNQVIEAIGGGICQVASTLYNALLYAEIEILERNAHSIPVSYVLYSREATIVEGLFDLRWRNHMETPIYIETVIVPGHTITFNIFGRETRPANRRIEFVSEATYGEIPQGIQFVASEYNIGSLWTVSEARPLISSYLTKIIFIDDVEVDRVQVNFSYYQESPRVVSVGTASYNPDNTVLMLEAIASQDYDTIMDTINLILFGWQPGASFGGAEDHYSGDVEGSYQNGVVGEIEGGYQGGIVSGDEEGYQGEYLGSYNGGY